MKSESQEMRCESAGRGFETRCCKMVEKRGFLTKKRDLEAGEIICFGEKLRDGKEKKWKSNFLDWLGHLCYVAVNMMKHMKKTIKIAILVMMVPIISKAQQERGYHMCGGDSLYVEKFYRPGLGSYLEKATYTNGQVKYESNIKDGIIHSPVIYFDKHGVSKSWTMANWNTTS